MKNAQRLHYLVGRLAMDADAVLDSRRIQFVLALEAVTAVVVHTSGVGDHHRASAHHAHHQRKDSLELVAAVAVVLDCCHTHDTLAHRLLSRER